MDGLVVRNLSISFGGHQALKKVSFQVAPGEVVGIIGPNGAGKTTLLNCLCRYYDASEGEIIFDDRNLLKKKSHQLLDFGISRSFQDLDLHSTQTVIENLMLGQHSKIHTGLLRAWLDFGYLKAQERRFRREARDLMRFFERVRRESEAHQETMDFPDIAGKGGYPDLLDVQDTPMAMLPYGVRKKTDLARALVSRPKLLLLDEPSSGLGVTDVLELTNLIKAFKRSLNVSILLVEHRVPLVMELCDRIIVLNHGEKIAEGTSEMIRKDPTVLAAYLGPDAIKPGGPKASPGMKRVDRPIKTEIPAEEVLLEVREVDLVYGAVKALSGISLKVQEHKITAILGNNGAGKSSLLRAISGLEHISGGEIFYRNERLAHWLQEVRPDKIVRQGVVHVAEGRRIFRELSVMENLRLAGYTCKSRKQLAQNIEKVFHYFPELKRKLKLRDAGNLSGGQQQMLAIGQALVMEPQLLLLDEPSLGLSPNLVAEVFEIIHQISVNEKCAVLIVEQNVDMLLRHSSYAYVLETGFIVGEGPSSELLQDDKIKMLYLGE